MIVYIHGANATSESFAYIRQFVRDHIELPDTSLTYKSSDGFKNNLANMKGKLDDADTLYFVGHSLGGIYALHLANYYRDRTVGGTTISTPYGGCVQADFAKYFMPFNQLMRDIGPMSGPMIEARKMPPPPNWANIVTMVGDSPWITEPNDGVVTIKSMQARNDFQLIEVPVNHYEVVLNTFVVETLIARIKQAF